jgi:predicted ester cyclase
VTEESANKQAVRDYLLARATKDLDLLAAVVTDDFHHEMLGVPQDRAGLFDEVASVPFRDGHFDIETLVEESDQVACRYRFTGVSDTEKPVSFTGLFIVSMRDGRLASGWGEYDSRQVSRQLHD